MFVYRFFVYQIIGYSLVKLNLGRELKLLVDFVYGYYLGEDQLYENYYDFVEKMKINIGVIYEKVR